MLLLTYICIIIILLLTCIYNIFMLFTEVSIYFVARQYWSEKHIYIDWKERNKNKINMPEAKDYFAGSWESFVINPLEH